MTSFTVNTETPSISFLPLAEGQPRGSEPAVELSRFPMARRIVNRLGHSLRQLSQRARRFGPVDGGTVVLLTGSRNAVGCTTVSLALAATACRDEAVALIDGDFQSATLTRELGSPAEAGWPDMVQGRNFENAGRSLDSRGNLEFFPLAAAQTNPGELLTGPGLAGWFARLRQDCALTFVDGGSVSSGAADWAPWVDVSVVVCRSGADLSDDWARAWDRLEEAGTHVLGIIETFV